MYSCSTCGKKAEVSSSGEITRSCKHTTKIVMDLECTLYGEGQAVNESPVDKLVNFFRNIGASVINRYHNDPRKVS